MSITKKLASVFAGVVVAFVAFGMMASSASAISAQALMDMGLTAEQAAVISALFAEDEGSSCVAMDTSTTMGIQAAVNDMGYLPALAVDGVYGSGTRTGVAYLQTMVGAGADGVFGAQTRMAYEAYVADNCDEVEMTEEEEEEEETNSSLSGGETSLEDWDMSSEDDAEEGADKHVATIKFDVEDADALMNRMDVSFFPSSVPTEDEPWDSFKTLTLMVDGDEVASEDIDDEDDWLDDNFTDIFVLGAYDTATDSAYTFRFSGMEYIVEAGDEAEIEVYLTAKDNVDDAGVDADWTIFVDDNGLRALDGEGINSYFGDDTETVTFTIEAEGGDEDIELNPSSNDVDESTLTVDDSEDSNWYEVFVFELEAEENEMDIDTLVLTVDTTGNDYDQIVDDVEIEIDGTSIDDVTVTNASSTTATLTFDVDKDASVAGDDEVDVVVLMKFRDTNNQARYQNGDTIQVATVSVDAEGVDDQDDFEVVSGEEHTLIAAGLTDTDVTKSASAVVLGDDTIAKFTFDVELTAIEDTFYIAEDGSDFAIVALVNGTQIGALEIISTTADTANGGSSYKIDSEETFTVEVQLESSAVPGTAQSVYVTLDDLAYNDAADLTGTSATLDLGAPEYKSASVTVIDAAA